MRIIISVTFFALLFACTNVPVPLHAHPDSIAWSRDFSFQEGIYFTVKDLKNNTPVLTPEEFDKHNSSVRFYEPAFLVFIGGTGAFEIRGKLKYADSAGAAARIAKEDLIVCRNGTLFFKGMRVMQFGKVCFAAYRSNGLNLAPNGNERDYWPQAKIPTKDHQFLISFDTGNIYSYTVSNLEMLLEKKDKTLYDEFSKLSNKEKKNSLFIYMNKLNERNPVYILTSQTP